MVRAHGLDAVVNEMSAIEAKEAGYICGRCATQNGGKWPEGHRATFHVAPCGMCGIERALGCWDDWDWPGSSLEITAKQTREV